MVTQGFQLQLFRSDHKTAYYRGKIVLHLSTFKRISQAPIIDPFLEEKRLLLTPPIIRVFQCFIILIDSLIILLERKNLMAYIRLGFNNPFQIMASGGRARGAAKTLSRILRCRRPARKSKP